MGHPDTDADEQYKQGGDYQQKPSDYIVLGRKVDNYMIFNGIHLFSRNEDFGETHQKSHFLLILTI